MELKLLLSKQDATISNTINRTKVELKFRNCFGLKYFRHSINRTKVELKLIIQYNIPDYFICYQSNQSGIEIQVIASPHWLIHGYQSNQSGIEIMKRLPVCYEAVIYQSNQSGIEIAMCRASVSSFVFYQSNQSGIEILQTTQTFSPQVPLSIEPKWNWNLLRCWIIHGH